MKTEVQNNIEMKLIASTALLYLSLAYSNHEDNNEILIPKQTYDYIQDDNSLKYDQIQNDITLSKGHYLQIKESVISLSPNDTFDPIFQIKSIGKVKVKVKPPTPLEIFIGDLGF